jgi:hypothetical protein
MCFESGFMPDEQLVISFLRVLVRPVAIALKCGKANRQTAWSFVFQGWTAGSARWVTLVERNSDQRPVHHWRGCQIDTDKMFRKFRLLNTHSALPGVSSFSLEAFEIHGAVFPQADADDLAEHGLPTADAPEWEFDPWAITE